MQPAWRRDQPRIRAVTRPITIARAPDNTSAYRIVVDVREQIGLALACERVVLGTANEERADSSSTSVDGRRERSVDTPQPRRERCLARDHGEMDVAAHERVGKT